MSEDLKLFIQTGALAIGLALLGSAVLTAWVHLWWNLT